MKYVMFKCDDRLVPVIFPNFMVHSVIAKYFGHMLASTHDMPNEVLSAGEIHFDNVECSGESATLKVGSRAEDSDVIETYDYTHGADDPFTSMFVRAAMRKATQDRNKCGDSDEDER